MQSENLSNMMCYHYVYLFKLNRTYIFNINLGTVTWASILFKCQGILTVGISVKVFNHNKLSIIPLCYRYKYQTYECFYCLFIVAKYIVLSDEI